MHTVAVVLMPGVVPGDLAAPCEILGRAQRGDGHRHYDVRVCAAEGPVSAGAFAVMAPYRLDTVPTADTVVVPGVHDIHANVPDEVVAVLVAAHRAGRRLVSICTGAFVLGAAGLLDGRRATTHWAAADTLARRCPQARIDPDVLYVRDGSVWTSAGAAAGLDLCLQLVRHDLGAAAAAQAARMAVMPLERPGGQAQFIARPPPHSEGSLGPLLTWAQAHLDADLSVDALARRGGMSRRTLARRFRAQTGQSPTQWVHLARVRHAQALLETTDWSVERVAEAAGFGSATTLRTRFRQVVDTTPQRYRRAFRRTPVK